MNEFNISKEDAKQAAEMLKMFKDIADRINNEDDDTENRGITPRVKDITIANIKELGGQLIIECLKEDKDIPKIGIIENSLVHEAMDAGFLSKDTNIPDEIKPPKDIFDSLKLDEKINLAMIENLNSTLFSGFMNRLVDNMKSNLLKNLNNEQ